VNCSRVAELKTDGTDITEADKASHKYLTEKLKELFGEDVQILSEEGTPEDHQALQFDEDRLTFVIDPLDGTSNFKNGSNHFAVLLGVLRGRKPVYGVISLPAFDAVISGGPDISFYWERKNKQVHLSRPYTSTDKVMVPSRFLGAEQDFADFYKELSEFQEITGLQKMVGSAHILSRLTPVLDAGSRRFYMASKPNQRPGDWDIAAFDAILQSRGGIITNRFGDPIKYGMLNKGFKHQSIVSWPTAESAQAHRHEVIYTRIKAPNSR